jgi:hypothetical protein
MKMHPNYDTQENTAMYHEGPSIAKAVEALNTRPRARRGWAYYDTVPDNRTDLETARAVQTRMARLGFSSILYVQQEVLDAQLLLVEDASKKELEGEKIFVLLIADQYHNADLLGQLLSGGNAGDLNWEQRIVRLTAITGRPINILNIPQVSRAVEKVLDGLMS